MNEFLNTNTNKSIWQDWTNEPIDEEEEEKNVVNRRQIFETPTLETPVEQEEEEIVAETPIVEEEEVVTETPTMEQTQPEVGIEDTTQPPVIEEPLSIKERLRRIEQEKRAMALKERIPKSDEENFYQSYLGKTANILDMAALETESEDPQKMAWLGKLATFEATGNQDILRPDPTRDEEFASKGKNLVTAFANQRRAEKGLERLTESEVDQSTAVQIPKMFAKSFGQSVNRSLAGLAGITGDITGGSEAMRNLEKVFSENVEEYDLIIKTDEDFNNSLVGQYTAGLGQLASTLAFAFTPAGVATKVGAGIKTAQWIGQGVASLLGAGAEYNDAYESAIEMGMSEEEARSAAQKYAPAGILDVAADLTVARFLKVPGFNKKAFDKLAVTVPGSAILEGGTEGLQKIYQNEILGKPWYEGAWDEALIGGLVGGSVNLVAKAGEKANNYIDKKAIEEATARATTRLDEVGAQLSKDALAKSIDPTASATTPSTPEIANIAEQQSVAPRPSYIAGTYEETIKANQETGIDQATTERLNTAVANGATLTVGERPVRIEANGDIIDNDGNAVTINDLNTTGIKVNPSPLKPEIVSDFDQRLSKAKTDQDLAELIYESETASIADPRYKPLVTKAKLENFDRLVKGVTKELTPVGYFDTRKSKSKFKKGKVFDVSEASKSLETSINQNLESGGMAAYYVKEDDGTTTKYNVTGAKEGKIKIDGIGEVKASDIVRSKNAYIRSVAGQQVQTKGAPTTITPAVQNAINLVNDVKDGTFAADPNSTERLNNVARENGIEVTPAMTPDDIVSELNKVVTKAIVTPAQGIQIPAGKQVIPLPPKFEEISEGHKAFSKGLDNLVEGGALTPEHVNLIKEIFRDTSPEVLATTSDLRTRKKLASLGLYSSKLTRNWITLRKDLANEPLTNPAAEPSVVFLHEYGHFAYFNVLNYTERQQVRTIYRKLKNEGKIIDYTQKGIASTERMVKYLAKDPEEFIAQSFAEYVITQKNDNPTLQTILQKIYNSFKKALQRVSKRATTQEAQLLAPILEKMRIGREVAPTQPTAQPTTTQPTTTQPTTEQPVTEQPVTEQPVTEQPVAKEKFVIRRQGTGATGYVMLNIPKDESVAIYDVSKSNLKDLNKLNEAERRNFDSVAKGLEDKGIVKKGQAKGLMVKYKNFIAELSRMNNSSNNPIDRIEVPSFKNYIIDENRAINDAVNQLDRTQGWIDDYNNSDSFRKSAYLLYRASDSKNKIELNKIFELYKNFEPYEVPSLDKQTGEQILKSNGEPETKLISEVPDGARILRALLDNKSTPKETKVDALELFRKEEFATDSEISRYEDELANKESGTYEYAGETIEFAMIDEKATSGTSVKDKVATFFKQTGLGEYAKRLEPRFLRFFGLGNRSPEVQRIIENIESYTKKLGFQAKTIGNRLRDAAEMDNVKYDEMREQINKALITQAEGPSEAQFRDIEGIAQEAGANAGAKWIDNNLTQAEKNELEATKGDPIEWLKNKKSEDQARKYQNSIAKAEKDAKTIAITEIRKANLNKSYQEAAAALNALPTNLKQEVLRARAELEAIYGKAIKGGVIPYGAKVTIGDRETDIEIGEVFWIQDNEAFAKKIKQNPDQIAALTRSLQTMYVNNRIQEIRRENSQDGEILTDDEARAIAENEMTLEKAEEVAMSYINAAVDSPNKAFQNIIVPALKMTPDQALLGPSKILKDVVSKLSDPEIAYQQLVLNVAEQISFTAGFNKMKELGLAQGWIIDPSKEAVPEGYKLIDKSSIPALSRTFKGLYLDPIFIKEIQDTYQQQGDVGGFLRTLIGLNGFTMASQTVLSFPRGYIRNLVGNSFIFLATGNYDLTQLGKELDVITSVARQKGNPEILNTINRLQELGVLDQNIDTNMIQNQIKIAKAGEKGIISKTLNTETFKKGMDFASRWYNWGDNVWKLAVFRLEEKTLNQAYKNGIPPNVAGTESTLMPGTPEYKAKIEELAADRVKDSMVSFNRMNALGRLAKKPGYQSLMASFIGFTSEMIRIAHTNVRLGIKDINSGNDVLKRAGYRRLTGMIAANTSIVALAYMMKDMFGIGEEEEEAARRTLAPWDKNATLLWWRDKDGNLNYFNTSFINPYSMISADPIRAALTSWTENDEKGVKALGESILSGLKETFGGYIEPQIFAKAAAEIAFNKRGDNQIYNPEASAAEIGWDISAHLADVVLPGTVRQAKGLARAITGESDRQGRTTSLLAGLANFFFARSATVNPETSFRNKMFELNKRKRDSARIVTGEVKTKGTLDDEDVISAYNNANDSYYNVMSDAARFYRDQLVLGTDPKKLDEIMKEAAISAEDIRAIKRGYINPYSVSKNTLSQIPPERAALLEKIQRETEPREFRFTGELNDAPGLSQQKPGELGQDFKI